MNTFKSCLTEIYSLGSIWQYGSIGSENGFSLNSWRAIMWSNVGMFYWHIYVSLSLNELRKIAIYSIVLHTNLYSTLSS